MDLCLILQIANLKDIYLLQMGEGRKVYAASSREWLAMNNALKRDEQVSVPTF